MDINFLVDNYIENVNKISKGKFNFKDFFKYVFFLENVELFWELIFNIMNINFWKKKFVV